MSRARGNKQYLSFNQGLITESSLLDFPEGATTDELNFLQEVYENKRVRRKGFEDVSDSFSVGLSGNRVYTAHYWESEDLIVLVSDIGSGTTNSSLSVHKNDDNFTKVYGLSYTTNGDMADFSEINDGLVVTRGSEESPLFLEIDDDGNLNIYSVNLYIRDFNLLDDDLAVTERPASLSEEHQYNIYNAGWWQDRKSRTSGDNLVDPVNVFFSEGGASASVAGTFDSTDNTFSSSSSEMQGFSSLAVDSEIIITNTNSNNGTYTKLSFWTDVVDYVTYYYLQFNETVVDETVSNASLVAGSLGYPSNADLVVLGMKWNTDATRQYFYPQQLIEETFGNTVAPRGHYVYNISDFDRDARLSNKTLDGAQDNTLTFIASVVI